MNSEHHHLHSTPASAPLKLIHFCLCFSSLRWRCRRSIDRFIAFSRLHHSVSRSTVAARCTGQWSLVITNMSLCPPKKRKMYIGLACATSFVNVSPPWSNSLIIIIIIKCRRNRTKPVHRIFLIFVFFFLKFIWQLELTRCTQTRSKRERLSARGVKINMRRFCPRISVCAGHSHQLANQSNNRKTILMQSTIARH